jgi:hypothetical protein
MNIPNLVAMQLAQNFLGQAGFSLKNPAPMSGSKDSGDGGLDLGAILKSFEGMQAATKKPGEATEGTLTDLLSEDFMSMTGGAESNPLMSFLSGLFGGGK